MLWETIVTMTKESVVWKHVDMENAAWTPWVQAVWETLTEARQKKRVRRLFLVCGCDCRTRDDKTYFLYVDFFNARFRQGH